ncbi:unnamed protein product, partial [Brenthis ino]
MTEELLRGLCSGLISVRATERKKNAESLKEFLNRNAGPSFLTNNTLKKSGYTWNHLFNDINDYIMKETEKYETAKTFHTVTAPLCTSLLHLCVAGANKGRAYIKCERITEASLNILNDSRLRKAIGDAYLILLYKHVLPYDYYLGYITPSTWDSLLDVSISACLTDNSSLDELVKIRLLLFIVKNARNCCQFAIPLRDSLSRVKKYFLKIYNDKKVQEFIMEIIVLLIDSLYVECRLTICEFTESLLPIIFKFYEASMVDKKKLLRMVITIHHPLGGNKSMEGFLANCWETWRRLLQGILEIVCMEINCVQRMRKQNEIIFQCRDFYYVASSAFYQTFDSVDRAIELEEAGTSAKKQKLSFNKNKSFSDLLEELRINSDPWIGIILMYVKHYSFSISFEDHLSLLTILEGVITSNNKHVNWDCMQDLTCFVIQKIMSHPEYKENCNTLSSFWSVCVRNATIANTSHKAIHTIMHFILNVTPLKYHNIQPLLATYIDKGMPVNDHSLMTINILFNKFYRKSCNLEDRKRYFAWLTQSSLLPLNCEITSEFLIRLLCNENFPTKIRCKLNSEHPDVYNVIFFHMGKSILYNEFEYEILSSNLSTKDTFELFEINSDMYNIIVAYLEQNLVNCTNGLMNDDIRCIDYVKHITAIVTFLDTLLKCHLKTINEIKAMPLYTVCCNAFKNIYRSLTETLKSEIQVRDKIALVKAVQNVLLNEYSYILNVVTRKYINEECFHCIYKIISQDVTSDDADMYEDDVEFNAVGLKQNCMYLISAYCRKHSDYTDELVKRVLDNDLYNFGISAEVDCAIQCITILIDGVVEGSCLESIFSLMQDMCRILFRSTTATRGILRTLLSILESIWSQGDDLMRQNCLIMIKSYLQRCQKMPPDVAALVYECVAKVIRLNKGQDADLHSFFTEALTGSIVGDNHCIRLYSCHLLTVIAETYGDDDIKSLSDHLSNIFKINVSDQNQTILRDESMNRALTVLRCFYLLGTTKTSSIHDFIFKVLLFENEKSMDKKIVKKVLNMLTQTVMSTTINDYMNNNILRILSYWFGKNKTFESLPIYLFGFENMDDFMEKHMKWLVSTDALWRTNGVVTDSSVIKRIKVQTQKSDADIIEISFCNIITLCLPYVVMEKYNLENERQHLKIAKSAIKIFQSTRLILKNEKWSNLFVENLGELIYLTAKQVWDVPEASKLFKLNLQNEADSYTYSKHVFSAILKYFGELIDENIMPYLCKDQPLLILNILFKLWDNVLVEKVFDFKGCALHAYLSFVESIPLGYSSDALYCNFLFASFTYAIKNSENKREVQIFVEGLRVIISKIINHAPKTIDKVQKSNISNVVSVLNIKMEKGYYEECDSLLKYLTKDMKDDINESIDVIDCINLMTHDVETNITKYEFSNKLKAYMLSLSSASLSTITRMCQFLKENKSFVMELYTDVDSKGFSENCKTSLIHQVVFTLTNLLKTSTEEKIIIEACNCLAEVCTYDLKTLVTVPPPDTRSIMDLSPKQYFANLVLESLLKHIFDEDPIVSKKITHALSDLLKYRDGQLALEMAGVDKAILQSLSAVDCQIYAEYKIDNSKFDNYNAEEFWVPNNNESHLEWIARITAALLDLIVSSSNYLKYIRSVCIVKPTFCWKIMPALMGLILTCSTSIHLNIFSEQIKKVFEYICEKSYTSSENSEDSNILKESHKLNMDDKMIVEYMLSIVDFVRLQTTHYKTSARKRPWNATQHLQLEYSRVARAAAAAQQHWPALYYGELHAARHGPARLQDVFRRSYVAIGEIDAVDGCGIEHLTSEQEKRKHLMSTGQYADALLLHDIALSRSHAGAPSRSHAAGAVACLHRAGMHHLALRYIHSYPENEDLDDIKYDCLSYLGDWSDFVDTTELETKSKQGAKQKSIIKAMRYACLKDCINIQPTIETVIKLENSLNRAKLAAAKFCQNLNMENCQSVYKVVGYLHLFRDIENYFSVRCDKKSVSSLIEEWKVDNLPAFNDFKHLEPLISQRSLLLENIAKTDSIFLSSVNDLQLQYAELGLKNNRIQMAQRLVAAVKTDETSMKVVLLESQISWAKGHKDIALSLLRSVVSQTSEDPKLTAISLRQYGLWMSECKRESSSDIHEYLKKSLEALSGNDDVDTRLKVYYDIAKFADAEYKQVVAYMESSVFENKVKCVESMKGTAESLKTSQQTVTRDEDRAYLRVKYRVNYAFGELDEAEIASTRAEKENFLKLAMRYYLLSLKQSDENDLSIFRVISLWLDNIDFDFEDEEFDFSELLHAIPSWKFIAVLPQLAPRLSNDSTTFAEHLRNIMMRCASEHPHHTLPILFSLKNSDKGEGGAGAGAEPRVRAAAAALRRLAERAPLATLVHQMDLICDATISFAYCVPKSKDLKPQAVPKSEAISRLRDLNAIPVPTDTVAIRKDCDYSHLSTLKSFENYFELVGGVNYPKKISCMSSDGKKRILLIKGKDDMRQDAVMQQVFNIVNTLLEKNPITRRNKLLIRTYKVVPLSRRAGVLQWCAGTVPLGAYLVAAHAKYRPEDITPTAARNKLKACHDSRKSNKHKLEVFKEILKVFKPVFHYFFTEHYLDPVTWYERRLAYTKSVAASSMVGYILGIGDRHVYNILIDKTTAEVIHIDFGIAFDQGKTLPTPETIPFRLTQDIIAGFGSNGVEGSFRRCCEKTLQLLRDNQETLLTILEVLLCDPLYLWTVPTTPNANTSRGGGGGEGGLAARALRAVGGKLCGARVSVPGHVAQLLRAAAAPANLARLFPGWQPYM